MHHARRRRLVVETIIVPHSHLGLGDRDILDVEAVDMAWVG